MEKRPNHRPRKELKTTENLKDQFYTIYETAEILKVHHNTIRRALKRGDIKGYKIGKDIRIPKSEILKGE